MPIKEKNDEARTVEAKVPITKIDGQAQAAEKLVPTWTLRADRKGDVFALVALRQRLINNRATPQEISKMDELLREFELYEQAHR